MKRRVCHQLRRDPYPNSDANTPHVDAITGATSQSEAVKKAVSKAMLKSSKALAAEEGADPNETKSVDVVVVGSGGAVWRRRFRLTTKARAC
ncbi:FMN-binding protein [Enterobacter hormaechei]